MIEEVKYSLEKLKKPLKNLMRRLIVNRVRENYVEVFSRNMKLFEDYISGKRNSQDES